MQVKPNLILPSATLIMKGRTNNLLKIKIQNSQFKNQTIMKDLFKKLNNEIVEAIVTGNYDVVDNSDYRNTKIKVDGIAINLWTGNHFQNFGTYHSFENDLTLTFSEVEKEMLHSRFKLSHEETLAAKSERSEYERLKAKFENK